MSLEGFPGLRQETLGSLDLCRWPQGASHGGSEKPGTLEVGGASRLGNFSLNKQDYADTVTFSLIADQHFFKSDCHIFCNSNHWFDDISIISGSCFGDKLYSIGEFLAWECILV